LSRFAQDWLALREPYDRAARSGILADRFADSLGPAPHVIDLGCGTGANLRYLAPRLQGEQRWLCVDRDRDLLAAAEACHDRWCSEIGWQGEARFEPLDLATDLDSLPFDGVGVSASALLDLVSAAWLDRLAVYCRHAPVLMALTFNGKLSWRPALADDELILARLVAHQRTDKGFGPALGPEAAAYLGDRLDSQGHRVETAISDWQLGAADRPLIAAMLDGVLAAAAAIEHDRRLEQWADIRRGQLDRGDLGLAAGHVDLLALPRSA
jgi:SAM-dependent methyltransferase